jgi:hypothetical protein
MKQIKEFSTRLEFAQDTINYYWGRPERQNVDSKNQCQYEPVRNESDGCAIGRHLPNLLCNELDRMDDPTVNTNEVFDKLPEWMKALGKDFLRAIQLIHDGNAFQNKNKLFVGTLAPYLDIQKITYPDETTNDIQG